MITILFFLGISLSQVSAMAIAKRAIDRCTDECCRVRILWNSFQALNTLKKQAFTASGPASCCERIGSKRTESGGIQGTSCTKQNNKVHVLKLDWASQITLNGVDLRSITGDLFTKTKFPYLKSYL
jgi:hypothetical protein